MRKAFCSLDTPALPFGFLLLVGAMLLLPARGLAATHYVDLNNLTPATPFATWDTAATNIQDAVDIALAGDDVLVTNGVYQTGARAVYGISNRVAVTKAVRVQSVNGPSFTTIVGDRTTRVRCVYLTNGAVMAGFTLTNGATQTAQSGGGVWCESASAVVSNCVLVGNLAFKYGGGAYQGSLNNCTLTGNSAIQNGGGGGTYNSILTHCNLTGNSATNGGGAYNGTLNYCTLTGNSATNGGGACNSTLNYCTLTGNSAYQGGGAFGSILNNCTMTKNSAALYGGGAYNGALTNCTVTANSASYSGGGVAGLLNGITINNSIIYYNKGPDPNENYAANLISYSCTTPLPFAGLANFTNAPLFITTNGWSNLRLQSNSPCINAGNNAYAYGLTDLDGRPRIVGGVVDLGAYEFQPGIDGAFIDWLAGYSLPTDGSADYLDPDGDAMNNWQEWMAGTNPINASSVLQVSIDVSLVDPRISFTAQFGKSYRVERSQNLAPSATWEPLPGAENIPGTGSLMQVIDSSAQDYAQWFYRVRLN